MLSMVPLKKHTRQNRILMSHSHHPGNINTANYNNLFSDKENHLEFRNFKRNRLIQREFFSQNITGLTHRTVSFGLDHILEYNTSDIKSMKVLHSNVCQQIHSRIPTVKLKIPGKAFLKSESRTSVRFKLQFLTLAINQWQRLGLTKYATMKKCEKHHLYFC